MIVDPSEFVSFSTWFSGAIAGFAFNVLILMIAWLVLWYAFTVLRHGPTEAILIIARAVTDFFLVDGPNTSPRRIGAMARLAVKESLRRRVVVVFAVFVIILLFAGWMLDTENDHPSRLYLGFVLTMSNYLVLALAMFLSAFSLPTDIENRTIYTITTKPVRPMEIFWGRVLGFVIVGTVLLVVMGLVSSVFVYRGLYHTHEVDAASLQTDSQLARQTGETTHDSHHRHDFFIDDDSTSDDGTIGTTDPLVKEHRHMVTRHDDGTIEIGHPQDQLRARVPVYGKLSFISREGNLEERGLNVGKEWSYRSYIEGGVSQSAAIWTFSDVTAEQFPEGLPLELDIRVFRTSKGDIESQIRGEIILMNPNPDPQVDPRKTRSTPLPFRATEFAATEEFIDLEDIKYQDADGQLQKLNLFEDLVDDDGNLQLLIRCVEHAQFFGMAQADVYLKARETSFWMNYAKCYVGIWLQMVLVVLFGVFFSTFLTGIVALQATLATLVLGMFGGFIADIQSGEVAGGGPIESLARVESQEGVTTDLDIGEGAALIDRAFMAAMGYVADVVPKYPEFNTVRKVAYGYDIRGSILARHLLITLGYFLVLSVMGYFILKTREFAA
jgi:hypothetical protein